MTVDLAIAEPAALRADLHGAITWASHLQRRRRRGAGACDAVRIRGGAAARRLERRARAFDALLDGSRIREDLGFQPKFPRLADAIAAFAE